MRCLNCEVEFKPKRRNSICCSRRCGKRHWEKKNRKIVDKKYFALRYKSKKSGIDYATRKEFTEWYNGQKKVCHYCGVKEEDKEIIHQRAEARNIYITQKWVKGGLQLDRKNPVAGYTIDNMVLACFLCNILKYKGFTYEEFKLIANKFLKK